MGFWFSVKGSVQLDKYGDARGIGILLDRHLFSNLTDNYKRDFHLETSLGKLISKEKNYIVPEIELIDSISIKLDCSGHLSNFENYLILTINKLNSFPELKLERMFFHVSDMSINGYYIYNVDSGLVFVDLNTTECRTIDIFHNE